MTSLDALATAALLGTERRPPEWPVASGPLGEFLDRVPREPVERAVLQMAGILGTCQMAGWQPPVCRSPPQPAPNDIAQQDSRLDLLATILADGPVRLQAEAFQKVYEAGRLLPHRLLPKALENGRRSVALRASLFRVLGSRGSWLASQNEDWSYGAGVVTETCSDDLWHHGNLDQRREYLKTLREQNSAKARELVAAACQTEGARERSAFIETLATGLTQADEPVLEESLADKSKEVRQVAARLLSLLPESRFSKRMIGYVQGFLHSEKKFLRGTSLTLEAPESYVAAWKSDSIDEAKPKGHPLGDRAWWLFQIVRFVPLSWWESQTGLSPAALIDWGQKSDWKDALLQGWAEAQSIQRRQEWAEAFLKTALPANGPLTIFDLLETLPPSLREPHLLRLLSNVDAKTTGMSTIVDSYLKGLPLDAPLLTAETSAKLTALLKKRIHHGDARFDWQLRASLVELTCLLPLAILDEYSTGWDLSLDHMQPFAEAVVRIGIVSNLRQKLYR